MIDFAGYRPSSDAGLGVRTAYSSERLFDTPKLEEWLCDWVRNSQYAHDNFVELKRDYGGVWVAIYGKEVIDFDQSAEELAGRVHNLGQKVVYINLAKDPRATIENESVGI